MSLKTFNRFYNQMLNDGQSPFTSYTGMWAQYEAGDLYATKLMHRFELFILEATLLGEL